MTNVPNLDALSAAELETWLLSSEAQLCSAELRRYADYKIRATRCRLEGNIALALRHERGCEKLYEKLPAEERW